MVDDFIGQGGTLANLRGWVEKNGGRAIGAVGLTGKPYSAKLSPTKEQVHELRTRHGQELEKWWKERFGHAFDCLTQSEARYLARSPDVKTIREKIVAAGSKRGSRSRGRSPREQRRFIKDLKVRLQDQFPDGKPRGTLRPVPACWQGYARPEEAFPEVGLHSVFDQRAVVFAVNGGHASLVGTLKLTAAFRGLLLQECPVQPPPEWFSGHGADGLHTIKPHSRISAVAVCRQTQRRRTSPRHCYFLSAQSGATRSWPCSRSNLAFEGHGSPTRTPPVQQRVG